VPRRVPGITVEARRYLLVGVVALAVDVVLFNLLRFAGGEGPLAEYPLASKVLSSGGATVVAWFGNRHWTFHHRRRQAPTGELVLFCLVAGLSLTIAVGCLGISHYVLGLRSPLADNISANVVGLVLSTGFRFWAYRRFVFNRAEGAGDPVAVSAPG